MLLPMFAAVVVGGTRLGGGRGGPIGSIFGAYILMIVVNILLVLNVSAYYSTIAEGTILILAVLAGSLAAIIARWRAQLALMLRTHRAPGAPARCRRQVGARRRSACALPAWQRGRPHDRASAVIPRAPRETAALRAAGLCRASCWCVLADPADDSATP